MITEHTVGYMSEFSDTEWSRRLSECQSVADLRAVVADWPSLTDAAAVVDRMTDADWQKWRLFHERSRPKSKRPPPMIGWARGYGTLLIPQRFLEAVTFADHYKVPFGVAWIRMKDLGWPAPQPTGK